MLSILDYGLGNSNSIRKSLTRIGVEAKIISTGWELASAEKIILPGVGHFSAGMKNLIERGLVEPLQEQVIIRKKPILGLCLGMQLMTQHSEEGDMHGLGWFKAQTIRFFESNGMRVPHEGWNSIELLKNNPLLTDLGVEPFFYFAHSYFVKAAPEDVLANTSYGVEFASVIGKENIFGVQFHPEKSHRKGLKLLSNFANL